MTSQPKMKSKFGVALIVLTLCNILYQSVRRSSVTSVLDHVASERSSTTQPPALPPVHWYSSWIGNHWIPPPGYHTYNAQQLLDIFAPHSVLFVGDSTARRAYATLYAILEQATNAANHTLNNNIPVSTIDAPKVIDIGKGAGPVVCSRNPGIGLCRDMPQNTHNHHHHQSSRFFDLMNLVCLRELSDITADPNSPFRRYLSNYTMVVFVLGPWEMDEKVECQPEFIGLQNSTDTFVQVLDDLSSLSFNTQFIWRTWAGYGSSKRTPQAAKKSWKNGQAHNYYLKRLLWEQRRQTSTTSLQILDWGQVMGPRTWPKEQRIAGDIDAHYGLGARLAFVHMLANHVAERERQERYQLAPWQTPLLEDPANDCLASGMPVEYCLTRDELQHAVKTFMTITPPPPVLSPADATEFAAREAIFCPACPWQGSIPCGLRVAFVRRRSKITLLEAYRSVMSLSTCNTSAIPDFTKY